MHAIRRLIAPLAAAAALAAAAVPAAHAATSFQIGTGAHPDIAVDQSGTAHVVWDENSGQVGVPDPLHYCQLPRGATACASERVLSPPLEAIGRSSYVFAPAPGRVLVETYRCCGPGEGNYLYESNDGGATFGAARQIGDIDHDSDAVFGPGETISGASVSSYQQMPLSGPAAKGTADFNAGFPIPTHSGLGIFGGTTPVQVMSDGGNTSFVAYQGGNANNPASWTDATPLTPPGGEPRLAGGPAGLVLLYRIGEPGKRSLAARKFDGMSFGDEEIVSEAGDPIEFDLSAEPSTGEFHAAWIDNRSPNELRWSRSKDGLTWTKPQTITRGDDPDNAFHTQVAAAPDEQGFAVWDQLSQNTEIRAVPLFPGASFDGAADSPAGSTTVGGQQITLFAPGGCINPGTPLLLRVTSKTKKKLSPKKRVKIVKVDFFLGKKKKTDKKAAFKAKFSTTKLAAPSTHKLRAKVLLRPVVGKGKKKTKTLKGKLRICG